MQKGSNKALVEKSAWNGTVGEIRTMFASQTRSMHAVLHRENEQVNDVIPELRIKIQNNTLMLAKLMESVTAMNRTLADVLQSLPAAKQSTDSSDASTEFGFP